MSNKSDDAFSKRYDNYKFIPLTEKELKKKHKIIDETNLEKNIFIKNKEIDTFGKLKKYVKSIKSLEKIENEMDDDDYIYMYNWFLLKEQYNNI